jgi:pimeloyl-ACP methyl ester carboxylesterase
MTRFHWPSAFLFLLTVLIIIGSLIANTLHVGATSVPARGKLFVLIQGIDTSLQNNDPPTDSFGMTNGIAPYLSRTYPDTQFLMYSYNGDNGNGYPMPYQCQDTFTSHAQAYALKLAKQLQDYLKDKPDMDVYLVAHSFGGIVAYGYLSYLLIQHIVNGSIPGTTEDRIAGVVTLDSPLGGISNDLDLTRVVLSPYYASQCPGVRGHRMLALDDLMAIYKTSTSLPHGGYNSVAKVLFNTDITNDVSASQAAPQGMHVLTIGNQRDYLYDPAACKALLGRSLIGTKDYLSTQWVSDKGDGSGIYGHYFADGTPTCGKLTDVAVNHGLVLIEQSVQTALGQFVNQEPVTALPVAIPGL